jgi:hypothetical protein
VRISWLTAFLDTPRDAPEVVEFWQRVTGSGLSTWRGDRGQFATLLPPNGDPYLRVQRLDAGVPGAHVDLHVPDIHDAAAEAQRTGATLVADHGDVIVLSSPSGMIFCVVPDEGENRRPVALDPGEGALSLVDQLCLDVAPDSFDAELHWWSELTGWAARAGGLREFGYLERPGGLPLRLLFQRRDEGMEPTRAHLDIACSDRAIELARHEHLGARPTRHTEHWDTLLDPAGREYCITDRAPFTG